VSQVTRSGLATLRYLGPLRAAKTVSGLTLRAMLARRTSAGVLSSSILRTTLTEGVLDLTWRHGLRYSVSFSFRAYARKYSRVSLASSLYVSDVTRDVIESGTGACDPVGRIGAVAPERLDSGGSSSA